MCCYSWMPEYAGNILEDGPLAILTNPFRDSVLQNMRCGIYSHCTDLCPHLNALMTGDQRQHVWSMVPKADLDLRLPEFSYIINFSYDESCNLQCPSCRTHLKLDKPGSPHWPTLQKLHDNVKQLVNELLAGGHTVQLNITGSGDAFASPLYWEYLQELASQEQNKNLFISIFTNGLLMTPQRLQRIENLFPQIRNINVSIDAASSAVYSKVRRGGNFDNLVKNLDYLDDLITQNQLTNMIWQNNFIVQADNWRDILPFVHWQLGYKNLNCLWFNQIAQWGHLDDSMFNQMAIWDADHAEHADFLHIFHDRLLADPRVYLGNLSRFIPKEAT